MTPIKPFHHHAARIVVIVLSGYVLCACGGLASDDNLYWPGTFEYQHGIFGGCYSNQARIWIAEGENHTPDGEKAWRIDPKRYAHLELLTPARGSYRIGFWVLTRKSLGLSIKVVAKEERTGKKSVKEIKISLPGKEQWSFCSRDFTVTRPYPGPERGEVLICCYNASDQPVWIDDVALVAIEPPLKKDQPDLRRTVSLCKPKVTDFTTGEWSQATPKGNGAITFTPLSEETAEIKTVRLSACPVDGGPVYRGIYRILSGDRLAGRKVRIWVKAGFLSIARQAKAWAGLLVLLRNGRSSSSPLLRPEPKPFWYVLSQAAPPGKLEWISAVYHIPQTSEALRLELMAQPGLAGSVLGLQDVRLELLP